MTVAACLCTVAFAGALALLTAGMEHMARPQALRRTLVAQRLLRTRWLHIVALAVAVTEPAVGGAAIVVTLWAPVAAPLPLAAQSTLYSCFAGYATLLRLRRPGTPCGCFGGHTPTTWLTVSRAGVMCVASGAAGAAAGRIEALGVGWRGVCLAAGALLLAGGWAIELPRSSHAKVTAR